MTATKNIAGPRYLLLFAFALSTVIFREDYGTHTKV
jgi:hypothetical protein